MKHVGKNFPNPTKETLPYWQGCKNRELLIQQCTDCNHYQFYPRMMCTHCMSKEMEWVQASGKGKIKTYTIIHRAISKAYDEEVPYVVAIIELNEGPTMLSNIIDCPLEEIEVGQEVEVTFEDWSEEITVPKFKPIN